MDAHMLNTIANFIWGIADDCLRDVYVRGKYRDVILPMTVIRRLDAVLEDTKPQVLEMKRRWIPQGLPTSGAHYAIQPGRPSATLRPSACAT